MYWELGFLRVLLYTIVSPYFIVKSLQLRGRRQIAEPRKYCLVRVIVFFDVYFLYLFCFSQVGILVKFPTLLPTPCPVRCNSREHEVLIRVHVCNGHMLDFL